jgi:urease accessory protein
MMFASASRSDPADAAGFGADSDLPASVRVAATLALGVTHADGVTRVCERREAGAFRFRFPRPHGRPPEAVMVNIAGGLAGGDCVETRIAAGPSAQLTVTSAAAERIYRSAGATTRLTVALDIAQGATALWLPQETILHDGARLRRRFEIALAPDSRAVLAEMLFLGRRASGEGFGRGMVHESWRIRRSGRLVFADETRIEGDFTHDITHPAALGHHVALATLVLAHPDAADHLENLRGFFEDGPVEAGATDLGGLILIRLASPDAAALRRRVLRLAARMAEIVGQPMPRALLN